VVQHTNQLRLILLGIVQVTLKCLEHKGFILEQWVEPLVVGILLQRIYTAAVLDLLPV
jgi:hypothetical protein